MRKEMLCKILLCTAWCLAKWSYLVPARYMSLQSLCLPWRLEAGGLVRVLASIMLLV